MSNMGEGSLTFQEVYETFRPRINRYLARLVSVDEAEDLTQEVFARISRSLDSFKGESSLSTWIYRVATNVAMDRLRSPAFRNERLSEPLEEGSDENHLYKTEGPPPMDQQLIKKEMSKCIRGILGTLPSDYRTVIALSEMEGLKNREIADILGITLQTVKIRLHRARARLKKELESHCSFYRDSQNEFSCEPTVESIKFKNKP
jgi:RNA polymerase sigma-70 factor (ECF subfamily)